MVHGVLLCGINTLISSSFVLRENLLILFFALFKIFLENSITADKFHTVIESRFFSCV